MSPAPLSSGTAVSADYKYILVNTLDDTVLAELPFQNVSYENSLNEAGSFSGEIPVNPTTLNYDLYDVTVPGLVSLYVLRGDACVWGGIIAERRYSAKEKTLSVTADEFVSYLDRRVLWKTWSTQYACKIDISDMTVGGVTKRIGKVTLLGTSTFLNEEIEALKDSVFISFGDEPDIAVYSGTYTILDREPSKSNWDLVFTRYKDTATQMGLTLTMNVSGVLQHPNVSVAKVPGAGTPSWTSLSYLDSINTIGYDWKYFDFDLSAYVIEPNRTYIIRSVEGAYYKYHFCAILWR